MPSSDPQSNQPTKHRACDDCRARKLACTKEPNGCSRCIREGIKCHYSEQKQMGRPRKRQRNNEIGEGATDSNTGFPEFPELAELENLSYFDNLFPIDSYIGDNDPLFGNENKEQSPSFSGGAFVAGPRILDNGPALFPIGNEFSVPIDFGADDSNLDRPMTSAVSLESSQNDAFMESCRNLFAGDKPHPLTRRPPCSCLATIYLAMSSLQDFPTAIETALATVRAAANAAQAAIRCATCSIPATTDLHPPIEIFQNTMLLVTILPIIVNGYKRLLVMVDEEAEIARAADTKKIFSMKKYGGLAVMNDSLCISKHLDMAVMDPTEWRAAVRGLLRADVYGLDGVMPGLRGIILEMEERQQKRHGLVDNLGCRDPDHESQHRSCPDRNDKICMRLLDGAKFAIDSLVIA